MLPSIIEKLFTAYLRTAHHSEFSPSQRLTWDEMEQVLAVLTNKPVKRDVPIANSRGVPVQRPDITINKLKLDEKYERCGSAINIPIAHLYGLLDGKRPWLHTIIWLYICSLRDLRTQKATFPICDLPSEQGKSHPILTSLIARGILTVDKAAKFRNSREWTVTVIMPEWMAKSPVIPNIDIREVRRIYNASGDIPRRRTIIPVAVHFTKLAHAAHPALSFNDVAAWAPSRLEARIKSYRT